MFDRLFQEINQDTPNFSSSVLADISNLRNEEMSSFSASWDVLADPTKIKLLSTLVEMGQNRAQLDFTSVFFLCLRVHGVRNKYPGI